MLKGISFSVNQKLLMSAHFPVLCDDSMTGLNIKPDGLYIDATFGRGGHSRQILQKLSANGKLIAIDKDLSAVTAAKQQFGMDQRFEIIHGSFQSLLSICESRQIIGKVNGLFLDLGVSSPQLDHSERGFSFQQDGPLDMRMDQTQPETAATWIATTSLADMIKVFKTYGEERYAKRIASEIIKAREHSPITTTGQLSKIVTDANPAWEKHKHPATRVFQAIRIAINGELSELETILTDSIEVFADRGRLVVISFHSLEDRIVKRFIRKESQIADYPKGLPIPQDQMHTNFKKIGKLIKANEDELTKNIRSRSAILRIAERQY